MRAVSLLLPFLLLSLPLGAQEIDLGEDIPELDDELPGADTPGDDGPGADAPGDDGPGAAGPGDDGSEDGGSKKGLDLGAKDMRDQQEAPEYLAPEPPADGIAGNWYLVEVACVDCPTLLEQEIEVSAPIEVIRGFNDQFTIHPDKTYGVFSEPTVEKKSEVRVVKTGDQDYLLVSYTRGDGMRVTDRLARVWMMTMTAKDKLLYGRYYQITALSDELWEEEEGKGYEAKEEAVPVDKILALVQLDTVRKLTKTENSFTFGDARIEFATSAAAIRSDFDKAEVLVLQEKMRADIKAEKERKAKILGFLSQAKEALHDEAWGTCVLAFDQAHKLGFENGDTWYYRGKCLEMSGDLDNAAGSYEKVLEGEPRDVVTLFRLAKVYEELSRPKDAIALYKRIEKATKPDSEDWKDAHYSRLDLLDRILQEDSAGED